MTDSYLSRYGMTDKSLRKIKEGGKLTRSRKFYLESLYKALNNLRRIEILKNNKEKARMLTLQLAGLTFVEHCLILDNELLFAE